MKLRTNYKIFGPPGTGKTTKLLKIIKTYRTNGLKVPDIRLLGFSNATVNHLKARAKKELAFTDEDVKCITTIHKFCKDSLKQGLDVFNTSHKKHFKKLFLTDKKNWPNVLEPGEGTDESEAEGNNWSEGADKNIGLALEFIKFARASAGSTWNEVNDYYDKQNNFKFARLNRNYVKYAFHQYSLFKDTFNLMDFEDMLHKALNPQIIFDSYYVVMVDECQDLDKAQYKVIAKIASGVFQGPGLPRKGGTKELWLAGDDDQAIFGWKGSNVKYFLKWPCSEAHKEPYKLKITHRLPQKIYRFAKEIISHIPSRERERKDYAPAKTEEGRIIHVDSLREIRSLGYSFDDREWIFCARAFTHCKPWIRYLKNERLVWKQKTTHDATRAFASSVRDKVIGVVDNWEVLKEGGLISPQQYYDMVSEGGKDFIQKGYKVAQKNQNTCSYDKERYPDREKPTFDYRELRTHHKLIADVNQPWYETFKFTTKNVVSAQKPKALYEDIDEYNLYLKEVWEKNDCSFPEPNILVSTIHGVKGMEKPNVIMSTIWNWPSYYNFNEGSPDERNEEVRVAYVGVTRTEENLFLCGGQKNAASDSYLDILYRGYK